MDIFDTISEFSAARGIFGGGFEARGGTCEGFGGFGFEEAGFAAVDAFAAFEGRGADSEVMVVVEGLVKFAGSGDAGTVFAASWRTCCNILEVTGVSGAFGAGLEGAVAGGFGSVFADADGLGAGDFGTAFVAWAWETEAIGFDATVDAIVDAFAGFGAAFVDFALVVDFFFSGNSISMRSEMTFLGLPLFLTTSADMLCNGLVRSGKPLKETLQ